MSTWTGSALRRSERKSTRVHPSRLGHSDAASRPRTRSLRAALPMWPPMKVSVALSATVTRFRRARADSPAGLVAPVRSDRRTKNLTPRLRPGDMAIIDHVDLDRVSAEALGAEEHTRAPQSPGPL